MPIQSQNQFMQKENARIKLPKADCDLIQLDGNGKDLVWSEAHQLEPFKLSSKIKFDPVQNSTAKVIQVGRWLLVYCKANEPHEIIAREATNGLDLWFDDCFRVVLNGSVDLSVEINPYGSINVLLDSVRTRKFFPTRQIAGSANISSLDWSVELAIDIGCILDAGQSELSIRINRQRHRRGLVPRELSSVPAVDEMPKTFEVDYEEYFSNKNELQIQPASVYKSLKSFSMKKFDKKLLGEADWESVPKIRLQPSNSSHYGEKEIEQTDVQVALVDSHFIVRAICYEKDMKHLERQGSRFWFEDYLEFFLSPVGYANLHLAINPMGEVNIGRTYTGDKPVIDIFDDNGHPDYPLGNRRGACMPMPNGIISKSKLLNDRWVVECKISIASICALVWAPLNLNADDNSWSILVARQRSSCESNGDIVQNSIYPQTNSATNHCPLRYALLSEKQIPSSDLEAVYNPKPVLSAENRQALNPSKIFNNWILNRIKLRHENNYSKIKSLKNIESWNSWAADARRQLKKLLFPLANGSFPKRTPLKAQEVYDIPADGFSYKGIIYESVPGVPVPATLFMPEHPNSGPYPVVLLVTSGHHQQRNGISNLILGANLARAGFIAMAIDGANGERGQYPEWEEHLKPRNMLNRQVLLTGEDICGWMVWDHMRAVDYLLSRGDVDEKKIVMIGSPTGGGAICSMTAAVDERIEYTVSCQFGEKNAFSICDDPIRAFRGGMLTDLTSPGLVSSLIAPRHFLYWTEFCWNQKQKENYREFENLYEKMGCSEKLGFVHGTPDTHSLGGWDTVHRIGFYRYLSKWLNVQLPDSYREEYVQTVPRRELDCFDTREGRRYLDCLKKSQNLLDAHQRAAVIADTGIINSRKRHGLKSGKLAEEFISFFKLTQIKEKFNDYVEVKDCGLWNSKRVEGVWISEFNKDSPYKGLGIASWIIHPDDKITNGVVICFAEVGKARFLKERHKEVKRILEVGQCVVLIDPRGCGETTPGGSMSAVGPLEDISYKLWQFGESLFQVYIKDILTVLKYLQTRTDINMNSLSFWGEGLSGYNGSASDKPFKFEESEYKQTSLGGKMRANPNGGFALMIAALLMEFIGQKVQAVLARDTLIGYRSILESASFYVSGVSIIPGLLQVGDIQDVAKALRLNDVGVRLEGLLDGKNRRFNRDSINIIWCSNNKVDISEDHLEYSLVDLLKL